MQRHRKKDRTERAPPTIQKYLHGTAGSPIGNSAPSPGTNENLYQSCVGGNATKTAACCRKDDLMFLTTPAPGPGSYPEDDPDCIEVYKEQQQKHDEQRHNAGSRLPEKTFGKWCAPNVNQRAREVGNLHTPLGDALLHHHQHQEQQQQQQQLLSCHPNISSAGSAEYSYAYCEPMLLQRPAPTGDASAEQQQLHTPVSTLSSSGSSYCVPVYAQRHQQQQQQHHGAPSLPLLQQQRPFRQPSTIRNPYQYTYGPAQGSADGSSSGTNTITTALHHHHHHHHHHSNYTLPNASSSSSTTTTTTTPTTTRTGSLRALFSNIFRKSSASSSAGHPSLASAAHSAPFLELDGSGTLQRSSFGGGGSASLLGAERHSFTTCYGTKENIYEDIGSQTGLGTVGADGKARDQSVAVCGSSSSTAPTGPPPPPPLPPLPPSGAGSPTGPLVVVDGGSAQDSSVAAERRRVQVQHDRIIGELNLSVERLIMPSCDDESVQPRYQEYAAEAHNDDCQQLMMMGQKPSYCLSSVATGGGGGGGRMTPSMGLRLSTKRHFPAAAAGTTTTTTPAATSSSSPPPTLGVGSERHSPTVSYGKSYGDVDSGISSSSTSGTSYSSSILYRSITNYPQQQQQQQQAGGGGGGGHHHHHHHPQRTTTKHSLFNLHLGSVGTNRAATCCRGPKDASIASRPEGFVGRVGSTNAVVTNAPDPPPPPDTGLMSYACPTSSDGSYGPIIGRLPNTSVSSQTLTSCCFLSDHNLAERDIGSRPFAATFAYNHHHHQQQRGARTVSNHATGGGSNFWARFRKLRLPITGTGGKLFSASSERQIDTELHLEDFTGESMWPEPGPRPVYHHHPPPLRSMQQPPPPPHQLALLPLDAPPPPHMLSPCGPTAAPLNGNLPPATHPRTTTTTTTLLHPFVVATGGESTTTGPPPRDDGRDEEEEEEEEDGSEHHPRQRSCSPSTPSSVASTGTSSASSSSSSSSVSPSSPMSPGSSSSCSSGATKHSGVGNESHAV